MHADVSPPERVDQLDLWMEELTAEELPDVASASTTATFFSFGSASCPYSTASSASCIGSA